MQCRAVASGFGLRGCQVVACPARGAVARRGPPRLRDLCTPGRPTVEVSARYDAMTAASGRFAAAVGTLADIERAVQRACELAAGSNR